jgi:hypothetical protein
MFTKRLAPVALITLILALAPAALSDDFDLYWHTIDGGGGMFSTGGDFELSGTIGQPDAGVMTGGDLTLAGGFWPGVGAAGGAPCPGDLNGDSTVDLSDLAQLLANYGVTSGAAYEDGDLDGDGDVDLADLAILLGLYGTVCG